MIMVESDQIINDEKRDKLISEVLKNIIPNKVKVKISSKKDRQALLNNFGEKAFLIPERLKFPIINPNTGKYECSLIYAARVRIKQYTGIKPEYKEIADKAEKLYNDLGCKGKLKIQILDNDEPLKVEMLDLIEFLI